MDLIGIITKDVDDKIIIIGLELLFLFNKQFFFFVFFFHLVVNPILEKDGPVTLISKTIDLVKVSLVCCSYN